MRRRVAGVRLEHAAIEVGGHLGGAGPMRDPCQHDQRRRLVRTAPARLFGGSSRLAVLPGGKQTLRLLDQAGELEGSHITRQGAPAGVGGPLAHGPEITKPAAGGGQIKR
jgi:hypothetical protein